MTDVTASGKTKYQPGALLRVRDICTERGVSDRPPGLLPVCDRTWLRWAKNGTVSPGVKLGSKTRAWPIEEVMKLATPQTGEAVEAAAA